MKAAQGLAAGAVLLAVSAMAPPALAHHSFAAVFDMQGTVETMEATVVEYAFVNPHSHVTFDTKNAAGQTERWTAQIGNTNALARLGWNKNILKPGDKITVNGIKARDGTKYLLGRGFFFPDGRKLFGNTPNATR